MVARGQPSSAASSWFRGCEMTVSLRLGHCLFLNSRPSIKWPLCNPIKTQDEKCWTCGWGNAFYWNLTFVSILQRDRFPNLARQQSTERWHRQQCKLSQNQGDAMPKCQGTRSKETKVEQNFFKIFGEQGGEGEGGRAWRKIEST